MINKLLLASVAAFATSFTTQAEEVWDFQSDTPELAPKSVQVARETIPGNTVLVVGESSQPPDPLGNEENQSLLIRRDKVENNAENRPSFVRFPFPETSAGTANVEFFLKSTGGDAGIFEVQVGIGDRQKSLAAIQMWTNSDGKTPGRLRFFSGNTDGSTAKDFDQAVIHDEKNTLTVTWGEGKYSVKLNGEPLTSGGMDSFGYANPGINSATVVEITTTGINPVEVYVDNVRVSDALDR